MGKENRRKAHQQKEAGFPFRMLTYWMKPHKDDDKLCVCGGEVTYLSEHYTDGMELFHLLEQGMSQGEATDLIWNQALKEQRAGHYTKRTTTYHCEQCVFNILHTTVGKGPAQLAMMPLHILGAHGSVILGNELQTPDDEGKPFTSFTMVKTIDELARQLCSEGVPIHLKGERVDRHFLNEEGRI